MDIESIEIPVEMDENTLRDDLRGLLEALKDNRSATAAKLDDLDRKFDTIPVQLDAIRKEFRSDQADLRKELQALFVPRSEYTPKHDILNERTSKIEAIVERVASQLDALSTKYQEHIVLASAKFAEYDRLVADSRTETRKYITDWTVMQQDIKALKDQTSRAEKKSDQAWVKIMTIGSLLIAAGSFALTFAQHVSIHP